MDTSEIKPSTPPLAKTETSEITTKLTTDTHELKTDNDMKKEENEIKSEEIKMDTSTKEEELVETVKTEIETKPLEEKK